MPPATEAARAKENKTWRADRRMALTEVKKAKRVSIYIGEFPYLDFFLSGRNRNKNRLCSKGLWRDLTKV